MTSSPPPGWGQPPGPPPPPGGWSTPPGGYGPPPPPAQDQKALWSMILGIASITIGLCCAALCLVGNLVMAVPAIVLGFMALAEQRDDPTRPGRSQALTGVITGFIGVAAAIVIVLLTGLLGFADIWFDDF